MNEFWRGFDLGRSLFCWKSAKSSYFCLWHIDRRESVSLFSTANLENSDEYGNKRCYSYVLEKGRGLMLILVFGLFQSLPYKIGCRCHAFFVYFSYVWKIDIYILQCTKLKIGCLICKYRIFLWKSISKAKYKSLKVSHNGWLFSFSLKNFPKIVQNRGRV